VCANENMPNPFFNISMVQVSRELAEVAEDEMLPDFQHVRSQLVRQRSRLLPQIPASIDDVNIEGGWAVTWRNEQFLSMLDNDWGIAVFSTTRSLRALQEASGASTITQNTQLRMFFSQSNFV